MDTTCTFYSQMCIKARLWVLSFTVCLCLRTSRQHQFWVIVRAAAVAWRTSVFLSVWSLLAAIVFSVFALEGCQISTHYLVQVCSSNQNMPNQGMFENMQDCSPQCPPLIGLGVDLYEWCLGSWRVVDRYVLPTHSHSQVIPYWCFHVIFLQFRCPQRNVFWPAGCSNQSGV